MADYNTFNMIDTKSRRTVLTTSSARKCKEGFVSGFRIDVWNANILVEQIYSRNFSEINKYISAEKKYIAEKQRIAHEKKERRRERARQRMLARA